MGMPAAVGDRSDRGAERVQERASVCVLWRLTEGRKLPYEFVRGQGLRGAARRAFLAILSVAGRRGPGRRLHAWRAGDVSLLTGK